jgi:hypothetical protein
VQAAGPVLRKLPAAAKAATSAATRAGAIRSAADRLLLLLLLLLLLRAGAAGAAAARRRRGLAQRCKVERAAAAATLVQEAWDAYGEHVAVQARGGGAAELRLHQPPGRSGGAARCRGCRGCRGHQQQQLKVLLRLDGVAVGAHDAVTRAVRAGRQLHGVGRGAAAVTAAACGTSLAACSPCVTATTTGIATSSTSDTRASPHLKHVPEGQPLPVDRPPPPHGALPRLICKQHCPGLARTTRLQLHQHDRLAACVCVCWWW